MIATSDGGSETILSAKNDDIKSLNNKAQLIATVASLTDLANPVAAVGTISASTAAFGTQLAVLIDDNEHNAPLYNKVADVLGLIGDSAIYAQAVVSTLPGGKIPAGYIGAFGDAIALLASGINNYQDIINGVPVATNEAIAEATDYINRQIQNINSYVATIDQNIQGEWNALGNSLSEAIDSLGTYITNAGGDLSSSISNLTNMESQFSALDQAAGITTPNINVDATGQETYISSDDGSLQNLVGYEENNTDGSLSQTINVGENGSQSISVTDDDQKVDYDVENLNGTSTIITFDPNGSFVSIDYNGPNGTGVAIAKDVESSDGSSALTTYNPDGSSVENRYSGPNGTGNLIETTSYDPSGAPIELTATIPESGVLDIHPSGNNITVTGIPGKINEIIFHISQPAIANGVYVSNGSLIQVGGLGENYLDVREYVIQNDTILSNKIISDIYLPDVTKGFQPYGLTPEDIASGSNIAPGYYYYVVPNVNEQDFYFEPLTVSCYLAGTHIMTPDGYLAVEALKIGDTVVAAVSHATRLRPIIWIGCSSIDTRRHPHPQDVWPVRVRAGAFGDALPCRDLMLSPDHAVYVDNILIPIRYLINGTSIKQEEIDCVTYYHVELAQHDVILAEGLPCESYLEVGNRSAFTNGGVIADMHPNFAPGEGSEAMWEAAGCAPLRIEGEVVEAVAARLHRRAAELGYMGYMADRQTRLQPIALPPAVTADLAELLQPAWYLATNPDVAAVSIDAHTHYAQWAGRQEGRRPCPEVDLIRGLGLIDPGTLAIIMPDVIAAEIEPVEHFCAVGWTERRPPNPYFDTGWYLDTHDVPAGMNPLLHYLLLGENQGLRPSRHFDPTWYRQRYGIKHTASPLAHYLMHRRTQRFSPLPTFDVEAYSQMHAATLLPERDPYAHFLAIGRFDPAGVMFAAESMAA